MASICFSLEVDPCRPLSALIVMLHLGRAKRLIPFPNFRDDKKEGDAKKPGDPKAPPMIPPPVAPGFVSGAAVNPALLAQDKFLAQPSAALTPQDRWLQKVFENDS